MKKLLVAPLLVFAIFISGCATVEPVKTAETPEQKAFALYGTYVIYKEVGADLAVDPDTPDEFVQYLATAVRVADPASVLLKEAGIQLEKARARLKEIENQTTLDEFTVALQVFNERWADAQPKLQSFIDAVKEEI